jgi:hypothetical protein
VVLARFRQLNPECQIIALSATVRTSQEVADWLGAEHVHSTWRPVELREGVFYGRAVTFGDGTMTQVKVKRGGQVSDLVAGPLAAGPRRPLARLASAGPARGPEAVEPLAECAGRPRSGDGLRKERGRTAVRRRWCGRPRRPRSLDVQDSPSDVARRAAGVVDLGAQ